MNLYTGEVKRKLYGEPLEPEFSQPIDPANLSRQARRELDRRGRVTVPGNVWQRTAVQALL